MNFLNSLLKRICGFGLLGLQCGDDDTSDQESAYNAAVQPSRDYQADMMKLFKEAYMPYVQDQSGLWSQYGKPIQEGQLKTYQEVGLPAYRRLGEKISADVENPWLDTKPIFENIWKQTREKTAAEYAPIEQRTGQRLAGAGALETGAAMKMFGDIEQQKYKSLETQAIDQALQEFSIQAQQKQQAYENMFRYQGFQPQVNTGVFSGQNAYQPQVIPPYINQDEGGWSWGGAASGALSGAATGTMIAPGIGTLIGGVAGAGLGGMSGGGGGGQQDYSALFNMMNQNRNSNYGNVGVSSTPSFAGQTSGGLTNYYNQNWGLF